MSKYNWIVVLGLAILLIGCAPKPDFSQAGFEFYQARILLPETGQTEMDMTTGSAAGFMQIKNTNSTSDRLLNVSANFGMATLHETVVANNMVSMESVESIEFAPGATIEMKAGTYHVMIMEMRPGLKIGDKVELTFKFEKAGFITVPVIIAKP
jgi:copper(I)-binding protein